MVISKTPFRISLIGGGTDFPNYYRYNPGLVIGGTIDKFCYVTARFLPGVFDYKHRIVWSKNEVVNNNNQILHPTVKSVFKKELVNAFCQFYPLAYKTGPSMLKISTLNARSI